MVSYLLVRRMGRLEEVRCGEVRQLLPTAPVFKDDSGFWRAVDNEWNLIVMVSVIDEGLSCSGCCWVMINCSRML